MFASFLDYEYIIKEQLFLPHRVYNPATKGYKARNLPINIPKSDINDILQYDNLQKIVTKSGYIILVKGK